VNYIIKLAAVSKVMHCTFSLKKGEIVMCEIDGELYRGIVEGEAKSGKTEGKVLRPIYPKEREYLEKLEREEAEAGEFFKERVAARNLPMKLIGVEKEWEGRKLRFYFLSDQRVDFRELVKDLARKYHTRIELRQVGVRDFASFLGGYGPCGRPLCCSTFLRNKSSVRLEMAREQNIVVDPSKISGICGRLFCCLSYELKFYREKAQEFPKVGSIVETESGKGEVIHVNFLMNIVKVRYEDGREENLDVSRVKTKKMWWLLPRRKG